jgi:hypothetical protein
MLCLGTKNKPKEKTIMLKKIIPGFIIIYLYLCLPCFGDYSHVQKNNIDGWLNPTSVAINSTVYIRGKCDLERSDNTWTIRIVDKNKKICSSSVIYKSSLAESKNSFENHFKILEDHLCRAGTKETGETIEKNLCSEAGGCFLMINKESQSDKKENKAIYFDIIVTGNFTASTLNKTGSNLEKPILNVSEINN